MGSHKKVARKSAFAPSFKPSVKGSRSALTRPRRRTLKRLSDHDIQPLIDDTSGLRLYDPEPMDVEIPSNCSDLIRTVQPEPMAWTMTEPAEAAHDGPTTSTADPQPRVANNNNVNLTINGPVWLIINGPAPFGSWH